METYRFKEDSSEALRIGISLSGGGLRSAAFNLGVLQILQERGILSRAQYLAAVSGGNYIASAFMITAATSDEETLHGGVWRPGSKEEHLLRTSSTYLASGLQGRIWLAANYLYGLVLNITPLFLCSFLVGRALGLIYRLGLAPEIASSPLLSTTWPARMTNWLLAASVIAALGIVLVARWRERGGVSPTSGSLQAEGIWTSRLVVMAAAVVVMTWAIPLLVRLFRWLTLKASDAGSLLGIVYNDRQARFLVAGLAVLALILVAAFSVWLLQNQRFAILGTVLASLSGPLLLMLPCVMAADYGTSRTYRRDVDTGLIVGAVILLVFFALFVHNRRYSLHLFYRERLSAAFAVKRVASDDDATGVKAQRLPATDPIYLSHIAARLRNRSERGIIHLPELVVCAAVNTSDQVVPPGRYAGSYSFEADTSGGPIVGYSKTKTLERQRGAGGTELTLPSMMAISGAAISPLMGKFTLPPLRFLMAILNLRLGVWLPKPIAAESEVVRLSSTEPDTPSAQPQDQQYQDEQYQDEQSQDGQLSLFQRLKDGWFEPGGLYVWREALGRAKLNWRFIYITDGGHWENLGVTELVRRRCNRILAFDAGASGTSATADLGQAIAISRSDLGTRLEFKNDQLVQLDEVTEGYGSISHVTGTIHFPDSNDAPGAISYAKAILTPESSWDLRSFHQRDPVFPGHPTSDQLFDDIQFESYRALGQEVASRVLLDFPDLGSPDKPVGSSSPV